MSRDPEELTNPTGSPSDAPDSSGVRASEPAQSGRRRSSEAPLAQSWRDVLLRLSLSLPIDVELDQLTAEFMDGVSTILPTAAFGACVVSSSGAAPVVLSRLPLGMARNIERDPSRLFPGFHDERIFELEDGAVGSTLHLASPYKRSAHCKSRSARRLRCCSLLPCAARVCTCAPRSRRVRSASFRHK